MRQFSRITTAFSALANPSLALLPDCLHFYIRLLALASQGPGRVVVFRRDIIVLNGHFACGGVLLITIIYTIFG